MSHLGASPKKARNWQKRLNECVEVSSVGYRSKRDLAFGVVDDVAVACGGEVVRVAGDGGGRV